jgi:RNA polymerase sigma factor (sigma-70 family)
MTTTLLNTYLQSPGDDAFRPLVKQYLHLVYAACLRQLRDRHLAEDATQAVFLLLHRRAATLNPDHLSGWLLTAARFTCANMRKEAQRRARREQESPMRTTPPADTAAPDDEILRLLDEALSHLGAGDREAVALHYLQDQPHAAVGAALGVSEDAARKRTARALEKLRSWFARHGIVASAAALATLLPAHSHAAVPQGADALTHSILQTCRAGPFTPAAALAKGTQHMMLLHTLKPVAAAVIIAALAAGGWCAYNATSTFAAAASVAAAAPDLSSPDAALRSYADAFAAGDRKALQACCSDPGALPPVGDAVLSFMLAQNRLILAAAHAYHTDGQEARLFPTLDQILTQIASYQKATHHPATINGDQATITFDLPADQIAQYPESVQAQIRPFLGRPIEFVKTPAGWKLASGKTSPLASPVMAIARTDDAGYPVNDAARQLRVVNGYTAILDRAAAGIASGQYATWPQARLAIDTAKQQLRDNEHISDLNLVFTPATRPALP